MKCCSHRLLLFSGPADKSLRVTLLNFSSALQWKSSWWKWKRFVGLLINKVQVFLKKKKNTQIQ